MATVPGAQPLESCCVHFLVFNPLAGRGRARRALAQAETYFVDHGMPYRVLTTTRTGHATELVRTLPTNAQVIAIGGDGTAHEVAAACLGTERVLGIVPGGSGDDFAHALGIDRHDLVAALDCIRTGRLRRVDVGRVHGEPFINSCGAGIDADVAAHVHAAPAPFRGLSAYLYAIVLAMKEFELIEAQVDVDGERIHDGPALLVSAQNGPRSGGSFLFAPGARLDDGLLDVVIGGAISRAGTMAILPRLMRGRHLDHPAVRLVRGRQIRIVWAAARTFHTEGEVGTPARVFEIEVVPRALRVIAPEAV